MSKRISALPEATVDEIIYNRGLIEHAMSDDVSPTGFSSRSSVVALPPYTHYVEGVATNPRNSYPWVHIRINKSDILKYGTCDVFDIGATSPSIPTDFDPSDYGLRSLTAEVNLATNFFGTMEVQEYDDDGAIYVQRPFHYSNGYLNRVRYSGGFQPDPYNMGTVQYSHMSDNAELNDANMRITLSELDVGYKLDAIILTFAVLPGYASPQESDVDSMSYRGFITLNASFQKYGPND